MSADFGHVKISRKAYATDPYWNEPREFSRWEAWEWMIQAAAWKPYSKVTKRAGVLQLERGETPPLAERFLADHWGWGSKNRARRFLEELQARGRIRTGQRTADGTTYHLVNYASYQSTRTSDGPQNEPHADRTRTEIEAEKASKAKRKRTDARATPFPDDWAPTEAHAALARERGANLRTEVLKMRAWAESKGETRKSWDATFTGWLLRIEPRPAMNGNGRHYEENPAGEDWDPDKEEFI